MTEGIFADRQYGVLDFRLSEHSVLVSCKCNHFFFPLFCLFASFLRHVVLESEFLRYGFSCICSIPCLPWEPFNQRDPRNVPESEGFFFFSIPQMSGSFLPMPMPMEMPSPLHSLPRATKCASQPSLQQAPGRPCAQGAGWGPLLSRDSLHLCLPAHSAG